MSKKDIKSLTFELLYDTLDLMREQVKQDSVSRVSRATRTPKWT